MKGKRVAAGAVALVVFGLAVGLGWRPFLFLYRLAPLGLNARGFPPAWTRVENKAARG